MLNRLVKSLLTEQRMAALGLRHMTQDDYDAMLPVIEFTIEQRLRDVLLEPVPAYKHIADWWKKIPARMPPGSQRDQFGDIAMTAKSCLPLLDGMGLGYTMRLVADVNVITDDRNMKVQSGPTFVAASFHSKEQIGEAYPSYPLPAIKFHNPWMIRTRPGYSTLFIPPMNHTDEDRFTCMAAVVDTDKYPKQVNFPGLWHKPFYDGIIKAGTPLVTAIPFKRADVPREMIIRVMSAAEEYAINTMTKIQNARSKMYTGELREDRK